MASGFYQTAWGQIWDYPGQTPWYWPTYTCAGTQGPIHAYDPFSHGVFPHGVACLLVLIRVISASSVLHQSRQKVPPPCKRVIQTWSDVWLMYILVGFLFIFSMAISLSFHIVSLLVSHTQYIRLLCRWRASICLVPSGVHIIYCQSLLLISDSVGLHWRS